MSIAMFLAFFAVFALKLRCVLCVSTSGCGVVYGYMLSLDTPTPSPYDLRFDDGDFSLPGQSELRLGEDREDHGGDADGEEREDCRDGRRDR